MKNLFVQAPWLNPCSTRDTISFFKTRVFASVKSNYSILCSVLVDPHPLTISLHPFLFQFSIFNSWSPVTIYCLAPISLFITLFFYFLFRRRGANISSEVHLLKTDITFLILVPSVFTYFVLFCFEAHFLSPKKPLKRLESII